MTYQRATAVTGFTFVMANRSTGAALTGEAGSITGFITKDGGTQESIDGNITEEGNGQYSVSLTAEEMDASLVGLVFTHGSAAPVGFTIVTSGNSSAAGGESTLSLYLPDMLKEVGWLYLGKRDSSVFTSDERNQIDLIIEAGLRQFYNSYSWSFLEQTTTVATVADQEDYNLDDDFGGKIGPISFSADDNRWYQVQFTSESDIRLLRQHNYTSTSFTPQKAALQWKSTDGSDGQRAQLLLWPKPDAVYTLRFVVLRIPNALTDSKPYPLGGMWHGETLLESCLAITEQRMDDESGIHTQKYERMLKDSMERDKKSHRVEHFGYNSDGSDENLWQHFVDHRHGFYNEGTAKYGGSSYLD